MASSIDRAAVALFALALIATSRSGRGDPLRLRGDALAQTQSPVGLLMLRGEDRLRPWLDVELMAWFGGARDAAAPAGDVQTLTVRVRDPDGRVELRVGRFVFSAGAIRPLHVDGIRVVARPTTTTTAEAFVGGAVVPRSAARLFDLAMGARVAQSLGTMLTIGAAYVIRRRDGQLLDQEIGPDLALMPTRWLDVAGRMAYDLLNRGPADALASIAIRASDLRIELFGTHRSVARMLPATSLFSVLGDMPSTTAGATLSMRAFPRLDLLLTGAAMRAGGDLGGYGTARATLALDDEFSGTLGFELRRQEIEGARWSGARTLLSMPLGASFRFATELELVRPDVAPRGSRVWPWALVAFAYRAPRGWDFAAAVEAAGTRDDRREVHAMLRVSYSYERSR